jgi:hypothetical protein
MTAILFRYEADIVMEEKHFEMPSLDTAESVKNYILAMADAALSPPPVPAISTQRNALSSNMACAN